MSTKMSSLRFIYICNFISEIILTRVLDKNYKNLFGQLSYKKEEKGLQWDKFVIQCFTGGGYENILGPWLRLAQYNFFHGPNIFSYPPCKTLIN